MPDTPPKHEDLYTLMVELSRAEQRVNLLRHQITQAIRSDDSLAESFLSVNWSRLRETYC